MKRAFKSIRESLFEYTWLDFRYQTTLNDLNKKRWDFWTLSSFNILIQADIVGYKIQLPIDFPTPIYVQQLLDLKLLHQVSVHHVSGTDLFSRSYKLTSLGNKLLTYMKRTKQLQHHRSTIAKIDLIKSIGLGILLIILFVAMLVIDKVTANIFLVPAILILVMCIMSDITDLFDGTDSIEANNIIYTTFTQKKLVNFLTDDDRYLNYINNYHRVIHIIKYGLF